MSFSDVVQEDRRLVILRLLDQAAGATANDSILYSALPEIGHRCSRDQVRTELRWLEEQRLVTVEAMAGGAVLVATLTERGADVQAGRATQPGVKRPSPRL